MNLNIDLEEFKLLFPNNSNRFISEHFHISLRQIRRIREQFHLRKDPEYISKVHTITGRRSWEIYPKESHPTLTPEARKARAESIRKVIRNERRRLAFGLEPLTNLNLKASPESSRRAKSIARYKLKKFKGYIPDKDNLSVIYYDKNTKRKLKLEESYIKRGLFKFKELV